MEQSVSVIIAAYNAQRYIADAINSLLIQTRVPDEIIVVDDGSTDDTASVVKAYPAPVQYFYKENGGTGSARNVGIKYATGDLIAFLDADDTLIADSLEIRMSQFEPDPSLSIVYGDVMIVDNVGSEIMTYTELNNTLYPSGDVFATLLLHNFVPPIAYMVRRESLLQVGLYDETIRGVDDYDLMVRLAAHFHFRFINHPVANYRLHSEMSTLNIPERFTRDTVRLREKGFAMDAFARLSRRQQAQAYAVQGTTYMQLDKFVEARSWYVKALRTDPAFLRAYAQYLLTWLGKSVFERVVRLYRGQRNMQSLHDIANDLPPQA